MTDDIDILARVAYETGIDPIHYATEHVIRSNIVVWLADCAGGGPTCSPKPCRCASSVISWPPGGKRRR